MRKRRLKKQEADLDITSFMNLMIILVPVLLMSMVFSHVSVLDLKLPDLADSSQPQENNEENDSIELVILPDEFIINYPAGVPLKRMPKNLNEETGTQMYDYKLLSDVLQELKRQLRERGKDKREILILSQADTDYQTLVKAMDTVRSFKAVQVASVVDAELFPVISLGEAPRNNLPPATGGAK